MAFALGNLIKVTTSTTGTGTVSISGTVSGFLSMADGGISDGDKVTYVIENGDNSEIGVGTYTSSGTTLSRDTVYASTNSGNKVSLSGASTIAVTVAAENLVVKDDSGNIALGSGTVTSTGGGSLTGTWSNLGTVTTIDINGGTIDGTAIGLSTPEAGEFTTIAANGTVYLKGNTLVLDADFDTSLYVPSDDVLTMYTASAERVRIDASGNVGIGTTSPVSKLDCFGDPASPSLSADNGIATVTAGSSIQIQIGALAGSPFSLWLQVKQATNGGVAYPLAINPLGGNVGIGTDNPGAKLDVNGDVRLSGISTTASAANCFLDSGAGNNVLRSTSSLRYKTGIETMDPAYAESFLKAVRPVWYRSLADADNPDHSFWGVIAEELAEIDPRLVHWSYAPDAYEDVSYDVQEPVTTEESYDEQVIEIIDGQAVQKTITKTRQVPVLETLPLVDEDGEPILDDEGNPCTYQRQQMQTVQRTKRQLKADAVKVPDGVQYERFTVMLLAAVQYLWRDRVTQDIPFKSADAMTLDEIKTDYKARIDRDAERVRQKYTTYGDGMTQTYREKFEEAESVIAIGQSAANAMAEADYIPAYPVLSASVGIEAASLWEAAVLVTSKASQWAQIAHVIEKTRLGSKMAIDQAADGAGVAAAYEAVTWTV